MKISIFLAKDKSKTAALRDSKTPVIETKGVPVRVTTYQGATRTHGTEAVVIITPRSFRSFKTSAGETKLYLSPRAKFRVIEADLAQTEVAAEGAQ